MRSALKFLIPAVAASLVLAACGSGSSSSGTSAASSAPASTTASSGESTAIVKTAANTTLGATVLVNAQGRTLYSLSGEQGGKFICTSSACVQVWHPLSASTGASSGGVASLGTVKRPDGTEQVTYKGRPLYTFAQDQSPGEAKGQGIKDVGTWTAVTVSAKGASAPAPATSATTPTKSTPPAGSGGSSSGRYGY